MHKEVEKKDSYNLNGDIVDEIKAITDYGAFVDLGSYDFLLQ